MKRVLPAEPGSFAMFESSDSLRNPDALARRIPRDRYVEHSVARTRGAWRTE
jgi:hypothetical protein